MKKIQELFRFVYYFIGVNDLLEYGIKFVK